MTKAINQAVRDIAMIAADLTRDGPLPVEEFKALVRPVLVALVDEACQENERQVTP